MGNAQCGPDTASSSFDDDNDLFLRPKRKYPGDMDSRAAKFLVPHKWSRQTKWLVQPSEVEAAQRTQAEELVRRDLLRTMREEPTLWTNYFTIEKELAAAMEEAPSQVSQRIASGITTVSTATAQTKNHRQASSKTRLKEHLPLPLGNAFAMREQIDRDVATILEMAAGELTPAPLSLACTPRVGSTSYGTRVREYMTTLHLRFRPHCSEYYWTHLSRLLPDSPVTLAVESGIYTTALTPPRDGEFDALLASDCSETSSTAADAVDFGVGPPSLGVSLLVTGAPFLDLAITGSLGLVDRTKSMPHKRPSRGFKCPEHYTVLINRRSGFPIAVCALKAGSTGAPVVRIYATKKKVYSQKPVATTGKLGLDWSESFPLYTWAEIATEGSYPARVRYSMFMVSGSDGRFEEEASFLAVHESSGSPEILVVGKTAGENERRGCAILSLCHDEADVFSDETFLRLSVADGIDPSLMLCFAAFVDESMEKTMRLQTQRLNESNYRFVSNPNS